MWLKWLPWKFVIRRVARASGFVDPVAVLAQRHRFAQPSKVAEPIELLRADVVFHARGRRCHVNRLSRRVAVVPPHNLIRSKKTTNRAQGVEKSMSA